MSSKSGRAVPLRLFMDIHWYEIFSLLRCGGLVREVFPSILDTTCVSFVPHQAIRPRQSHWSCQINNRCSTVWHRKQLHFPPPPLHISDIFIFLLSIYHLWQWDTCQGKFLYVEIWLEVRVPWLKQNWLRGKATKMLSETFPLKFSPGCVKIIASIFFKLELTILFILTHEFCVTGNVAWKWNYLCIKVLRIFKQGEHWKFTGVYRKSEMIVLSCVVFCQQGSINKLILLICHKMMMLKNGFLSFH